MNILIHACPKRMWYVDEFLVPELIRQGAEVDVWNDSAGLGNLRSCVAAFASCTGDGGTWHIQDDVLPCRDFVKRCQDLDDGVVYGFCNERFDDDPYQIGRLSVEDAWHSFQCVRIPDAYARECADWFETDGKHHMHYPLWVSTGKMDDAMFTAFMLERHPRDMVTNVAPCLVEHVDFIVGGSIVNEFRDFVPRATWWSDEELVQDLIKRILERNKRVNSQ